MIFLLAFNLPWEKKKQDEYKFKPTTLKTLPYPTELAEV